MADEHDDLSNIPKSVLKQQRAAEKAIAAANEEPAAETPPEPAAESAADQQVVEPVIENSVVDNPVEPAIDDNQNQSQWEHKYSVLQGKYNKEVSDFRTRVADLELTLESQSKQIEELNSKQPATSEPAEQPGDLNSEDFEGWGPEMKTMVDTVNRLNSVIREQAAVINGFQSGKPAGNSEMNQRVETIEEEIGKTRHARYVEVLDNTIKSDWRQLNKDPKFIQWANQKDPITLQPRMTHLRQAAQELRGDQVASIFNKYIEMAGIKPTERKSFVDEIPAGGGHGDGVVNNSEAGVITAQDLTEAQNQHIQGKITEEEYDTIYKKFQAQLRRQNR